MARFCIVALLALLGSGCYATHERAGTSVGGPFPDGAPLGTDGGAPPPNDAYDPCEHPLGELIAVSSGTHSYRIEGTEVTRDAYDRFLACAGPPRCMRHPTCRPTTDAHDAPIRCSSPCEAEAYCAWAGRRLCTLDEWMPACRATAERVAPTGMVTDPRACVLGAFADGEWDYSPRFDTAQPVTSASGCHGAAAPFDLVYDVVGNVSELVWVSETDIGPTPVGFDYTSGPNASCTVEATPLTPDRASFEVGFRCCAD